MQRTLLLFWACAGLLAAAAAGCGSNQGCLDYAQAICTRQVACSSYLAKYDGANLAACQQLAAQSCQLSTKAPDSNFDQNAAETCAQALTAATCDVVLSGPIPAVCQVAGNRPLGAACGNGFQCQSLYCNRPTAQQCGTCAALAQSGDPCSSTTLCDSGLQCSGLGTCAPWRGQGEGCDGNFGCLATLSCSNGTCQTPMLGLSCAGSTDYCSQDALQGCDSSTMTCVAINYSVNTAGGSCGVDLVNNVFTDCDPSSYCKGLGTQSFGVCTALPVEGQPCAIENTNTGAVYQLCLAPTTCITGTCQIFDVSSCN